MKFVPSEYQQKIYDFIALRDDNLIINAVAGSGKTTTMVNCFNYIPEHESILFCCFNVSIASDINLKVVQIYGDVFTPEKLFITNIHKLGYAMVRSGLRAKRFQVKAFKYLDIIRHWLDDWVERNSIANDINRDNIKKVFKLAMANGVDYESHQQIFEFVEEVGEDLGFNDSNFVLLYQEAIAKGIAQAKKGVIDFSDMLYLPKILNLFPVKTYDNIIIDECQDLSATQAHICLAHGKRFSRFFMVGDPKQAIYGFAGADSNSFFKLKKLMEAEELPLSRCYRCSKLIVKEAQELVPQIESLDGASDGFVFHYEKDESIITLIQDLEQKDIAIISRVNAPLFKIFIDLTVQGIPSNILGKDLAKELVKLAEDIALFSYKFQVYSENLLAIYLESKGKIIKKQSQFEALKDKVQSLELIMNHIQSAKIDDLKNFLNKVFTDSDLQNKIILSSIHRAKGREYQTVFLNTHKLPLTWQTQTDSEYQQELNLKYVAITRAKEHLYYFDTSVS